MKEKIVEEVNELTDLLSDIGRDWDNYIDECQENEEEPCFSYDDFHAEAIIEQGYRKQSDVITEFKAIVRDYLIDKGLYLSVVKNALDYAEKEILNGKAD